MLIVDVTENNKCLICKKKYTLVPNEWINVGQLFDLSGWRNQMFCIDCWMEVAGEEYVFALPERLKQTGDA